MKTYLFSLLILLNISAHLIAMSDELIDIDFKEDVKDFSEWVAEYQNPIIAGSIVGCGAAISLYKWDKRPVVISSAIAGGYLVYKWLEDQENDDRTQRINALKEKYGIINSNIGEITDDLAKIRSDVISMHEGIGKSVRTFESIEGDLAESTNEMRSIGASVENTTLLLSTSIAESKKINSTLASLRREQDKFMKSTSDAHKSINDTDTANTDLILKAIAVLPTGRHHSSTAAGQ